MSEPRRAAWLVGELSTITIAVAAVVVPAIHALHAPSFGHPVRGEAAWQNFVTGSTVLTVLGSIAAWVVWLTWRRRALLDAQPDGPARLLAIGMATLPDDRDEWATALQAELASLTDRSERWRFAAGGARAALTSPGGWQRPAAGWVGGTIGAVSVVACIVSAIVLLTDGTATTYTPPAYLVASLVVVLTGSLAMMLAAPPALASSNLGRHTGTVLGIAAGTSLLLWSRAGALEAGALIHIMPADLLAFVVAPVLVALVSRSFRAALQSIVWGFAFSAVTMFPVYLVESMRRYRAGDGLYLDGDAPVGASVASNLTDAVAWLVFLVPGILIPVGILSAALVAAVARAIVPPARARRRRATV
jgi:hypothetical protein